jgi:hypothetical protein
MMIAPPEVENVGLLVTMQILAVSFMAVLCGLLVVLTITLHRAGHTMRELIDVFKPKPIQRRPE